MVIEKLYHGQDRGATVMRVPLLDNLLADTVG